MGKVIDINKWIENKADEGLKELLYMDDPLLYEIEHDIEIFKECVYCGVVLDEYHFSSVCWECEEIL